MYQNAPRRTTPLYHNVTSWRHSIARCGYTDWYTDGTGHLFCFVLWLTLRSVFTCFFIETRCAEVWVCVCVGFCLPPYVRTYVRIYIYIYAYPSRRLPCREHLFFGRAPKFAFIEGSSTQVTSDRLWFSESPLLTDLANELTLYRPLLLIPIIYNGSVKKVILISYHLRGWSLAR